MFGCLLGIKDPMMLGLLSALPLALLFIMFVSDEDAAHYSFNLSLGLFGYAISTFVFWYLFTKTRLSKVGALIAGIIAWIIITLILICIYNQAFKEKIKKIIYFSE